MSDQLLKPSELKSLLKFAGTVEYKLKRFLGDGSITRTVHLQNLLTEQDVVGKVVTVSNGGEFCHWPRIRHENLMPILDTIPLDRTTMIFVRPLEKCLRLVIEETGFNQHPKCFDRKKVYVRDVLCGLKYLHQISLALLNLNDENVLICSQTDKAVIGDFSCITSASSVIKQTCPMLRARLQPPEFANFENHGTLECKPVDMWCVGVMCLQIFTNHVLPWCELSHHLLNGLDIELLKQTNIGACLPEDAARSLRNFLHLFLQDIPQLRINSEEAAELPFLRRSNVRLDEPARGFWRVRETIKPIFVDSQGTSERLPSRELNISEFSNEKNCVMPEPPIKPSRKVYLSSSSSRKAKSDLYVYRNMQRKVLSHDDTTFQNPLRKNTSDISGSALRESNSFHECQWNTEPDVIDPSYRSNIHNFKSVDETEINRIPMYCTSKSKTETELTSNFTSKPYTTVWRNMYTLRNEAPYRAHGKLPTTNSTNTDRSKTSDSSSNSENYTSIRHGRPKDCTSKSETETELPNSSFTPKPYTTVWRNMHTLRNEAICRAHGKLSTTNSTYTDRSKTPDSSSNSENCSLVIEHDTSTTTSERIGERDVVLPPSPSEFSTNSIHENEIEIEKLSGARHRSEGGFLHSTWKTENIKGVSGQSKEKRFKIKRCSRLGNQLANKHAAEYLPKGTPVDFDDHSPDFVDTVCDGFAFPVDPITPSPPYGCHRDTEDYRGTETNTKGHTLIKTVEDQSVDIPVETLLWLNNSSDVWAHKIRKKPKKSWLRFLCPGSKFKRMFD